MDLARLRERLAQGVSDALLDEIRSAVNSRVRERGDHREWGLLCEDAGLLPLAFREFQLALRDDPRDEVASLRIALYHAERGETDRATAILEGLLARDPAREEWLSPYVEILREEGLHGRARAAIARAVGAGLPPARANVLLGAPARCASAGAPGTPPVIEEDNDAGTVPIPSEADCVRFLTLFSGREDVHARQWARPGETGGYSPVKEPLTPAVARNHLLGNVTVGVYPIRLDGTATFFALDLDIDRSALERAHGDHALARTLRSSVKEQGIRLLGALRDMGFDPLFEDSGFKGRHLWVFLDTPEPAEVLHAFGRRVLAWQSPQIPPGLHLEFFPKQPARGGKGLGNLIKLPLGVHRRSGRRSLLLDDHGEPYPRPFERLRNVRRASRDTLYAAIDRLKDVSLEGTPSAEPRDEKRPIEAKEGPPPPVRPPAWTEADFEADPRVRHLLSHCPVLAELKRSVDQHRRLTHEEQLVLINTLGHLESGPLAVNYLLSRCVDVGPEKFMKDRLKGNPISCPSIRRKIPHVTRRLACNCPFEFARDRYPTPTLHLLTLPAAEALPASAKPSDDPESLARRYAVAARRREEVEREWTELRKALVAVLRASPDRSLPCEGGRYVLREKEGVEELSFESVPAGVPSMTRRAQEDRNPPVGA